jgi:DNA-binding transcriptional ArsR family regulator
MSLDDPEPRPRPQLPEVRNITDARTLRALTHPVRIALLEALSLGGAMTATEVGEQIGESPTTCSFHLRQLAKYGFVEEAGGGKGRARPWRMSTIGMRVAMAHDDPEYELAAGALRRMMRERQISRYWTWLETNASYPWKWRDASSSSESVIYMTAEELKEFNEELLAMLLLRFRDRFEDPAKRPPGAIPVEFLLFSYPVGLPAADSDDASDRPDDADRSEDSDRSDDADRPDSGR